jgi:DNA invertase Pin-like site-specific DNA recombinase
VSRWGRFQDSDEGAYHEFICRAAGVRVEYCAEQFMNDGSAIGTIIKNIKRAMASEYSRELSVKVFAGQSRVAAAGYHVGSIPGYGMRRALFDEKGNRKMQLALGQRKSIKTERVILEPGPANETATVQYVYHLFVDQKKSLKAIARTLNTQGLRNTNGREWTYLGVRELLSNEKYMGNSVYGRTSKKFGRNWKRNPQRDWVRAEGAFQAVISKQRFLEAQWQLRENASHYTENEMLDYLTAIWCREKVLSRDVLDSFVNAPAARTYAERFGSLVNAFHRVGYSTARISNRENLYKIRQTICREIVAGIPAFGGTVNKPPGRNCQLQVNGELNVTVVVGRTSPGSHVRKQNYWRFGYRSQQKPDILLVARVEQGSSSVLDYYVLPFIFLPGGSWLSISGKSYRRLEGFRSRSLVPFFKLCARQPLQCLAK